jgi:zinc and cadmium transporter
MANIWLYSIISVLIISFISLIGVFTLSLKPAKLKKFILFLVSFSAGALLADSFIHLLPEAVEELGFGLEISLYILSGIVFFFLMEKFIHWRHCHVPTSKDHPHPFATMNLIGDGLHNFIDGIIVASSYLISIPLGITTTLAVLFHEIPQEIGDFGVLIHGGYSKKKALTFNFLSALLAVFGAVIALIIGSSNPTLQAFFVPFTAGGFIYIAGSDLIPELHKETAPKKSALQLFGIISGILIMLALLYI